MFGIRRGADGGHRGHLGDSVGCSQHGRAAKTVPDQYCGGGMLPAQKICGENQVVDIGAEVCVGKVAFALTQPGEVESQYSDAASGL